MFHWVSFLTYAVVTAVTPGPNNLMSMSNGSRWGFRGALPFNFGIWAGFSAVMVLCTVFCQVLTELIPRIRVPMMAAGAAYMLYLAWETWKGGELTDNPPGRRIPLRICAAVHQPQDLYLLHRLHGDIHPAGIRRRDAAASGFALLLAFIGFFFTLCWSAFGSAFRRLFSHRAKLVNAVMALLLVYCAVSLFLA